MGCSSSHALGSEGLLGGGETVLWPSQATDSSGVYDMLVNSAEATVVPLALQIIILATL